MTELTFVGAAGTVTGSKHLISTAAGKHFYVDCGMFQGKRRESAEKNVRLASLPLHRRKNVGARQSHVNPRATRGAAMARALLIKVIAKYDFCKHQSLRS